MRAKVTVPAIGDSDDLAAYGLARCRRCRRILLALHLEKNRCRPGLDCGAHELIARAREDGHPDAIAFARSVERGLLADACVPVQCVPDAAEEEIRLLLPMSAALAESPSEALRGLPGGIAPGKVTEAL